MYTYVLCMYVCLYMCMYVCMNACMYNMHAVRHTVSVFQQNYDKAIVDNTGCYRHHEGVPYAP